MPVSFPDSTTIPLAELGELAGEVITPGDPGYEGARTIFHGNYDRRPAAIVRPADPDEIARVISFAREAEVELAVRGGGHSGAGHGVSDGGVVLDLRALRELEIDAEARTAWAQTGLTAGEYTAAAGAHGLATGFGDSGSVGIGGITLGGGVGFLSRKHGLTIDNLLAAELVTADGELRRIDAETEPDLFWAIRGGGGNFGVATRLKLRLHPVEPFFGGILILPATPETVAGFVAAAEAAPEELSTIANVMPAPPLPFLPAERHGELIVMGQLAYVGTAEAGERAVAPFRALATPIADLLGPMPYSKLFMPEPEDQHPIVAAQTMFADGIETATAEAIVDQLHAAPAPMAVVQLRALGGAIARVPAEATAFAHRDRRVMANVVAIYQQREEAARHESWVAGLATAIRGETPGAYVNFLNDEGEARVREAYPGSTWDRLAAIKGRYDPTNLFRLNQNIPPA